MLVFAEYLACISGGFPKLSPLPAGIQQEKSRVIAIEFDLNQLSGASQEIARVKDTDYQAFRFA